MNEGNSGVELSVLLPVYNGGKYLHESISSVLNQTFSQFELIVIDDGSTDNSAEIVRTFNDPRIRFIHQENAGLAATLNAGLKLAKGVFIARQDQDDISHPDRFRIQLEFLKKHPAVVLAGTRARIIGSGGEATGRTHRHPTGEFQLKYELLFDNPFVHSSVIFRKVAADEVGGYSTSQQTFEDYNLWSRMAEKYGVANLPQELVSYREVAGGMSQSTADYFFRVKNQSLENIRHYCGNIPRDNIEKFVSYNLGLEKYENYRNAFRFFRDTLARITRGFAEFHHLKTEQFSEQENIRIKAFRRRYLNSVINDADSAFAKRLSARVLRRLLIGGDKG